MHFGNCVLVVIQNTIEAFKSVIYKIYKKAVDSKLTYYHICNLNPKKHEILTQKHVTWWYIASFKISRIQLHPRNNHLRMLQLSPIRLKPYMFHNRRKQLNWQVKVIFRLNLVRSCGVTKTSIYAHLCFNRSNGLASNQSCFFNSTWPSVSY